jgi:hypothetical protein
LLCDGTPGAQCRHGLGVHLVEQLEQTRALHFSRDLTILKVAYGCQLEFLRINILWCTSEKLSGRATPFNAPVKRERGAVLASTLICPDGKSLAKKSVALFEKSVYLTMSKMESIDDPYQLWIHYQVEWMWMTLNWSLDRVNE